MHDKSPIFVDSGHGKIWMFGILDTLCGVRAEKQYRLSSRIDKFETRAHVVDVFARDLLQSRTDAMLTTDTVP
jgi:hypothetical protein